MLNNSHLNVQNNNEIRRRKLLKLTGAATTATGVTAIAGCISADDDDDDDADPDEEEEITVTLTEFPDTIDPLDHITGDYFDIYDHIYEPVFEFDPGDGIFPWIAEDWEVTGDGSTEVSIRDDVTFHNGDTLTADDIAWTINRSVDPDFALVSDLGQFGLGSITGAEAIDETQLEITYGGAPGLAEFEFGNYARAMNREWAEDRGADEDVLSGDSPEDFNGTGPYEVVEFEPEVEIVVEKFDDYWGEEPPFDRVTFNADGESSGRFNALETGETDLTINILPEDVGDVRDNEDTDIRNVPSFRTIFCPMKNSVEPYDSQEFRQAMNYCVDQEEIIETILSGFGTPTSQPVSPDINGYNPDLEPYPQDYDMAESLVEESGYGGVEIELTAPQGRYVNDAEIAERVADMIDELPNVDCSANIVDFGTVSDENAAGLDDPDHPFYMIGWGTVTGDTDYGVQGFFVPEETRSFADDDLTDAIVESQEIEDPDERREALQEINAQIHDLAPWVFLNVQESIYGIREDIQWEPRADETIYLWEMSV